MKNPRFYRGVPFFIKKTTGTVVSKRFHYVESRSGGKPPPDEGGGFAVRQRRRERKKKEKKISPPVFLPRKKPAPSDEGARDV